ncbi:MAG: 16S rRNA (guanine(527)-N(7))-methyltransferase RsmG [Ruminococcaceae bacterium]|nr:16S rRNA (guanine(527)-N(7))-methyltransferase RsmG [Oscillospiraceae bacterium]
MFHVKHTKIYTEFYMNFTEFYNIALEIWDKNASLPPLTKETAQKLYDLTTRMLEVNKSMNLTAIKDEESVILRHYADSLTVSPYIPTNVKVIDVGCGAGFPTLPLAIFRPDISITALDSTAKRIEYVKETAKTLSLNNITAIAERAEVLANDASYRESFDIATARAVAAMPILTELCLPFVKIGGSFVAMKAAKGDDEAKISANAIAKCGGKLISVDERPLNSRNGDMEQRVIIYVSKETKTPKEFPRHYSKISKKPL